MSLPISGSEETLSWDSKEGKEAYRHTCSHIMAQAVLKLFPGAKLAIGPAIENGFYYDFDLDHSLTPEDLLVIEEQMHEIVTQNYPLERFELPREEAVAKMQERGEIYKVELIMDLPPDVPLSFYRQGNFEDLCAGPHLASTGRIKEFKLTHVAGAYWRGNEHNPMLQRIYGTAFDSKEELELYLTSLEEARKRDHRKLGRELDLFSIDEEVGPGLILWHPKLSAVREQIEQYWRREHRRRGYDYVYTPNIGMANLWETSGHLQTFSDGMYPAINLASKDETEATSYYIKPMNCPFHIQIYKTKQWSYRDLPLRWCELGNVYRYERSGTLHGMLRVRGFTQDDAHIICTEEQFEDEINRVLDFAFDLNRAFGFKELKVFLSVRDLENREAKYVGETEVWEHAEATLQRLLEERGIEVEVDVGGAKFYGPAIDLKAVDAMGRQWQGTTIQLDMNEPKRFGMTYIGSDGLEHTPIMLHRTLLGSMERFVGVLIEQYAGAFPTWLAPVQVAVLTITNRADAKAEELASLMRMQDFRVSCDMRNEKIGFKIREAQVNKVPYMLIIGDKEINEGMVAVRSRQGGDLGKMPIEAFMQLLAQEINSMALTSEPSVKGVE